MFIYGELVGAYFICYSFLQKKDQNSLQKISNWQLNIRFNKEKKFIIILTVIFSILSYSFINGQSNIIIKKEDSHKLPKSTIDIVDFDNVVIKNKEQIQIVNISDSNNYKIINSFILPKDKKYHSIQHGRFIILGEGHGNDFYESVYDVVTKQLINLQESDGSTGAVRIAQKDGAILYKVLHTSKINDKRYGKIFSQRKYVKLKPRVGKSKIIADSTTGLLWSPNEEWFLGSKLLRREGRKVISELVLVNRNGSKVILPSEESTISDAAWSADGNYLAIRHYSILTIFEIRWNDNLPVVKSYLKKSPCGAPILFSPDSNYLIYTKYYEDGHTVFGNDIMLTDAKLSFTKPIIKHKDKLEIPIFWTKESLITQDDMTAGSSRNINKYQIKYK